MIEPENDDISIRTQCALLQLNRSTFYQRVCKQPEISSRDLMLMAEIDRIYTDFPYYGSRRMSKELVRRFGFPVNRKYAKRLMQTMGIEAIYPKPNLSKPAPNHAVYPYLLKGVTANHPNHIWGVDITYIKLKGGFVYLVAFLDWFSRYVLSWELSLTLDISFVVEAAKRALMIGIPEIANSDQGSQFTSQEYISIWTLYNTQISMDGRGRAMDNIFTERLWRTVKYEEVYPREYQSPRDARESLTEYFDKYNNRRLHQSLNYLTPKEVYFRK